MLASFRPAVILASFKPAVMLARVRPAVMSAGFRPAVILASFRQAVIYDSFFSSQSQSNLHLHRRILNLEHNHRSTLKDFLKIFLLVSPV